MEKKELIKTRLYFVLSVLLLTVVCVVVYTSMRSEAHSDKQLSDLASEQTERAEDDTAELQQVSSTPLRETEKQHQSSADRTEDTEDAPTDTIYRLAVTDGCLQVYDVQTGQLYMETEIAFQLLPERVQAQILKGKYFESEEALLEFLENYSS